MSRIFRFDEGELSIPEEWVDQSINVLSSGATDGSAFTFSMSRDQMPWGMSYDQYVDREVGKLKKTLKDFEPLREITHALANTKCRVIEYKWAAPQAEIHQIMTMVLIKQKILVITATMPGGMSKEQENGLKTILESLTLNETS